MTDLYEGARAESQALREKDDCAVVAMTIATGLPYADVHLTFAACGRRARRRTPMYITDWAAERLGVRLTRVPFPRSTLRTIGDRLDPLKTYLVRTSGHIVCVEGGRVHDWAAGSLRRVRSVWEVTV